jgi:hypothetical protein
MPSVYSEREFAPKKCDIGVIDCFLSLYYDHLLTFMALSPTFLKLYFQWVVTLRSLLFAAWRDSIVQMSNISIQSQLPSRFVADNFDQAT